MSTTTNVGNPKNNGAQVRNDAGVFRSIARWAYAHPTHVVAVLLGVLAMLLQLVAWAIWVAGPSALNDLLTNQVATPIEKSSNQLQGAVEEQSSELRIAVTELRRVGTRLSEQLVVMDRRLANVEDRMRRLEKRMESNETQHPWNPLNDPADTDPADTDSTTKEDE